MNLIFKHSSMNILIKVSKKVSKSFLEELESFGWKLQKLDLDIFEDKFYAALYIKWMESGAYLDSWWDNFLEQEYEQNYLEYIR